MLHIMGNLPKEYEAAFMDLENILMTESGEKLTMERMHQKLNALFKRLQKVEEKKKALAAIKRQAKEKTIAVLINNKSKVHAGIWSQSGASLRKEILGGNE